MNTAQPVLENHDDATACEAPSLCIVVPCFNEEEVLGETASRLKTLAGSLLASDQVGECRILFVDDGSIDTTWKIICGLSEGDPLFAGLKLSRNRGHQNALLAGLMHAKDRFDAVISLDADLQDDIAIIPDMIAAYRGGSDIVYAVRESRETDSFFKRTFSQLYYKVMEKLGSDVLYNHADYRLMSKRALSALSEFDEVNLFLRGLVRLVGYPSSVVYYTRAERFAGESKYPLGKMLSFAFEGISSFSTKPLKFVTFLGGACLRCPLFCSCTSSCSMRSAIPSRDGRASSCRYGFWAASCCSRSESSGSTSVRFTLR